jgi:ABC-type dipeptide/oligopeptide/nickel transport system permease component
MITIAVQLATFIDDNAYGFIDPRIPSSTIRER